MIGIIDLGLGNIKSISNAINYIGFEYEIIKSEVDLYKYEKLILPGVGAFGKGCEALSSIKLRDKIRSVVLEKEMPILGICLGMQLLGNTSEETRGITGLSLIDASSLNISNGNNNVKIPHIGWNEVNLKTPSILFNNISDPVFYFLHSYHIELSDPRLITAMVHYGKDMPVAFSCNNIHGVQFHPEKSQQAGLQVLKNFCTS